MPLFFPAKVGEELLLGLDYENDLQGATIVESAWSEVEGVEVSDDSADDTRTYALFVPSAAGKYTIWNTIVTDSDPPETLLDYIRLRVKDPASFP